MKRLIFSLAVLSMLSGCAMYASTPGYYDSGGSVYVTPAPVYVAPPIYVAPPVYANPWYAGPPVFLNFGYRSWGGSRGYSHRGGRGYGGRGYGGRGHGHRGR